MKELDVDGRYSDFDVKRQILIQEAGKYSAVSEKFEALPGITKGALNILRRWGLDLSGRDKQNHILQNAALEFESSTKGVELACFVQKKSFDLEAISYYGGSHVIKISSGYVGGSGGHFDIEVSSRVNGEKFYNLLSGQYITVKSYGDEQGLKVRRIHPRESSYLNFEVTMPHGEELSVKRYERGYYDGKLHEAFPDYTVLPWSDISPARQMGDPRFQGSVEEKRLIRSRI